MTASPTSPPTMSFSDALRHNQDQILAFWEAEVRREVKASKPLRASELRDSIPDVLENLAKALEKGDKVGEPEIKVARRHGRERATISQYTIEQIIFEYRLLRRAIFEVLGTKITIDPHERDIIIDAIEVGISEATAEFANQQYELREQFISALAHDLRNPLTAAKTSAQLMLRYPERVESTQLLASRIVDTIGRTDRMIQDLLDSNQLRSGGGLILKVQPCDLRVLVQTTLEEASTVQGDRFNIEVTDLVIQGYWDPDYLRRAIQNLASNAVKYGTRNTPVTISISQTASTVSVTIHNVGNPMSQDEQLRVFNPFYRSRTAKSGDSKGWGVGLSLVKGVAEAHHGTVSVQSSEDDGTTFTLTLPKDCRSGAFSLRGVA